MNKQRRKELGAVQDRVIALARELAELGVVAKFESIRDDLVALKDEEEEYKDAIPESMQEGEKYETACAAVSSLENAIDSLDPLIDTLADFNDEDIVSNIDDARGME